MLLLTSPNDRLQIVTSGPATIVVHASWVDTNTSTGVVTPGATNTQITTASTTSVAGAPAAGVQRNIKTLHARHNGGPSSPADVTVQHTDGTVVAQLYKLTMFPADVLQYTDQGGFNRAGALITQKTGGVLQYQSAGLLKFSPRDGGAIKHNGCYRPIPTAGIAGLANTSVYVSGNPSSNLAANQGYFIFVIDVNGVLTANFQPFGSVLHGPSTASGNEGTEIMLNAAGTVEYQEYTLIGMCQTNASAQFQDDSGWRGVLSWFNRVNKFISGAQINFTTSLNYPQLGGIMALALNWANEAVAAIYNVCVYVDGSGPTSGETLYANIGIDGISTFVSMPTPGTTPWAGGVQESIPIGGFCTPPEGWHSYSLAAGVTAPVGSHFLCQMTGFTRG